MYQRFLPGLFLLLLAACNATPIEYQAVPLNHDLGKLYFRQNSFFDTLFQWTHTRDCDCCHQYKVRWADSTMPLAQETGWKYAQPDSVCQLTLLQPQQAGCDTAFQLNTETFKAQMKYLRSLYWKEPKWIYRKFEDIGDQRFLIIGWEVPRSSRYDSLNIQRLLAITKMNNEKVTLDFECRRTDCGNFVKRALWMLETMKIEEMQGDKYTTYQVEQ